jgi:uncharacterized phage-associated protein
MTIMRSKFNSIKALEIVLYLSEGLPIPNLDIAYKIIYLADKLHLENYGRLLFGDTYLAMKSGPKPKGLDRIIFDDKKFKPFKINEDLSISIIRSPFLNHLSKSDIECLDKAITQYGSLSIEELTSVVQDEAWKSADECDEISLEAIVRTLPSSGELMEYLNR